MDMSIRFPNLDINLGHIAKSLNFFGYEITVYGMLMAAGMLLGLLVVLLRRDDRIRIPICIWKLSY